jgi:hypothetical protein
MDKSKQQFEEFALSAAGGLGPGHLTKDAGGDYTNYAAQAYFDFWNGSRAALVIDRPEKCEFAEADGPYHKGYRQGIRNMVDAIEAAGLKVSS